MPAPPPVIELRGVRVRNLQNLHLDIPLGQLVAITGVSGAGKTSLAFDTLFAEGRRRYIETLSTAARGLLDPIERPEADSIGQIPPAIAVRQRFAETSWRPTVASAGEIHPLLRLLFAQRGQLICPGCQRPVRGFTPPAAASQIASRPPGTRVQIGFELVPDSQRQLLTADELIERLSRATQAGFVRTIVGERTLPAADLITRIGAGDAPPGSIIMVVDRLTASTPLRRLTESFEQACRYGHGVSLTFSQPVPEGTPASEIHTLDGEPWVVEAWSETLRCRPCGRQFADADPLLFSFNQPRSACPKCQGLGVTRSKVGADPTCDACGGARLNPEGLAWRVAGRSIADWLHGTIDQTLADWLAIQPDLAAAERIASALERRLQLLQELGLGYVELDRPLRTLSAGEAQRVRLAGALATDLVHMLYVLDEPTAGLHPRGTPALVRLLKQLRDAGNSVVVIEHDLEVIEACDHVIDLGPGAGREGGRVLFQGNVADLARATESATGQALQRRARHAVAAERRDLRRPAAWLEFAGVSKRTLHNLAFRLPLGVLCVVTGVSGSGKSTLVGDCVTPLVEQALRPDPARALPEGRVSGTDALRDVQRIDPGPLGRSRRNTPASFLGLIGPIRQAFAGTSEAQARNFGPGHFSLQAGGPGCCETCGGLGVIEVDMQFLPDLETPCPDCQGCQFRSEVLEVKYRGLSIAELLSLSVKEALPAFRGQTRIQRKLKLLLDVGLDALPLGQPTQSLSAGETQRLRLAECLSRVRGGACLLVLDEPTRGLHPADIARLLRGFDHVLAAGHSLLVVEHQPEVIAEADWVLELGPGAGRQGGRIVFAGEPPGSQ